MQAAVNNSSERRVTMREAASVEVSQLRLLQFQPAHLRQLLSECTNVFDLAAWVVPVCIIVLSLTPSGYINTVLTKLSDEIWEWAALQKEVKLLAVQTFLEEKAKMSTM